MAATIGAGAAALGAAAGGAAAVAAAQASSKTWRDRLRPAAYNSPSGKRIKFHYFDVSRETDLRTTPFDFPGVNDAYVQQNGYSSRRYPLRCVFAGDQCDLVATAFEAALLERGIGKLEHPLYGTFNVVPFGTITRRDDLAKAANQSVVEVTFWTTTGTPYPLSARDAKNEILAALEAFDLASAQQFAGSADLTSAVKKGNLLATVLGFVDDVSAAMGEVASVVTSVNNAFQDLQSAINRGMDVFIGQPLLLAQQISNLCRAPSRAAAGIDSRMAAYGNLATRIFSSPAGKPATRLATLSEGVSARTIGVANDFQAADLFSSNAVAGSISAAVADPISDSSPTKGFASAGPAQPFGSKTFSTKPQAIAAAEAIAAQLEAALAWRDSGYAAFGGLTGISPAMVDTGESYAALKQAASLTTAYLVDVSFSLVPERRIVLDRARTIIDVAAELYGSTSNDTLDFLIATNNLVGDDMLELPRERAIVYYPR